MVKGKGTDFMARLVKGGMLDFIGPLGIGFKADEEIKNYLLFRRRHRDCAFKPDCKRADGNR